MGYKLVPKDVPSPKKQGVLYTEVMDDFLKNKANSVLVQVTDKKPSTLHQGLLKARREPQYQGVRVVRRGAEVYLVK